MISLKTVLFASIFIYFCTAETENDITLPEIRQLHGIPFLQNYRPFQNRCPLCDSSVYSYCGEKLFHDACCCTDPYINRLPYECKLADCRFLHAKTCREHLQIANCCCSDDYRSIVRSLQQSVTKTKNN